MSCSVFNNSETFLEAAVARCPAANPVPDLQLWCHPESVLGSAFPKGSVHTVVWSLSPQRNCVVKASIMTECAFLLHF